jgi:hypothetical protein
MIPEYRPDETDKAVALARARHAWSLMSDSERAVVRFGMTPIWVIREGFDGRDRKQPHTQMHAWPNVERDGTFCKLVTLALMDCAKADGGMVC